MHETNRPFRAPRNRPQEAALKLLDQIIDSKRHRLISIAPDATVFQALNLLARYDIGALLVMVDGKALGVFSERDFARKVLLMGKDAR